jgi:hypothetical protein
MEKSSNDFSADAENYLLNLKDFLEKAEILVPEYVNSFPHVKRFSLSKEGEVII